MTRDEEIAYIHGKIDGLYEINEALLDKLIFEKDVLQDVLASIPKNPLAISSEPTAAFRAEGYRTSRGAFAVSVRRLLSRD